MLDYGFFIKLRLILKILRQKISEKPGWLMRIENVNPEFTENTGYFWIIESFDEGMSRISHEQVVALIY